MLGNLGSWHPIEYDAAILYDVREWYQKERPCVVLAGCPVTHPDAPGRFGVIAKPDSCRPLSATKISICDAVDNSKNDIFSVLLLGYELSYEALTLNPQPPPVGQPYGVVIELKNGIVIDHFKQRWAIFGVSCKFTEQVTQGWQHTPQILPKILETEQTERTEDHLLPAESDWVHKDNISKALAHITAGDIYQANICRRLSLKEEINFTELWYQLLLDNPVAHGALISLPAASTFPYHTRLISNSMETLLRYSAVDRIAKSYPIKGTCDRRSASKKRVDGEYEKLLNDPKERAEHVMIVDLVRNDLGKVCDPGTVKVEYLMEPKGFSGVWHGVSKVVGRLSQYHTRGKLLQALFPGGSITGTPKKRAVEIIQQIEQVPRGFYTGSLVMMMPNGDLSASILIRTVVEDAQGYSLSVGGGIVADSKPERELAETWEKIAVFEKALVASMAAS